MIISNTLIDTYIIVPDSSSKDAIYPHCLVTAKAGEIWP